MGPYSAHPLLFVLHEKQKMGINKTINYSLEANVMVSHLSISNTAYFSVGCMIKVPEKCDMFH